MCTDTCQGKTCRELLSPSITSDRHSGEYSDTFKYKIVNGDGKTCGSERKIIHIKDKSVSTTNLVKHVTEMDQKYLSHPLTDVVLKNSNTNYVTMNEESQKTHGM